MEIGRQTVMVIASVCAPVLIVGLTAGLVVSIFQAATQVSESTLSFLPKIAAVLVTLLIGGGWILEQLTGFTTQMIMRIAEVGP